MAPGLPDRVDYVRLAAEGARLDRVYALDAMPRLRDVLADPRGSVAASFEFARLPTGRPGATVSVKSEVWLTCQRCLQGFAFPVDARSEIEFAASEAAESPREVYAVNDGLVSLRELAEEELLLALPIVAMCAVPETCGQAPMAPDVSYVAAGESRDMSGERSRPFAVLQDLLKKT
jgi:uncharacterized protein